MEGANKKLERQLRERVLVVQLRQRLEGWAEYVTQLAQLVSVLGDAPLAGEGAVVVGDKGVGAEAAHAVWGCAADVGEEDMTSLVASGIL